MIESSHKQPSADPVKSRHLASSSHQQRGFTMVELLVAMVISLLIALAAIAALTVTRRGFSTVDASSQLRDNGRFTADLIQRLGVQSGFKDVLYAARPATQKDNTDDIAPSVTGFNNAFSTLSPSSTDPFNAFTSRASGTLGYGSDILYLRNQLVQLDPGSNDADGSMIDCMGNTVKTGGAPTTRDERMTSVLHIDESPQGSGELALMCTTINTNETISTRQPIIQGVENFQVLYGTEGVTPGTAPAVTYGLTANAPAPASSAAWTTWAASINQVPDRYLRADQMTVAGDTVSTNANWRRVRSIRIGMILRGPPNSAQNAVAQTLYPFGPAKSSGIGSTGSAFASASDPGTIFNAPADGRLRQVVTFTVHLRNSQGL